MTRRPRLSRSRGVAVLSAVVATVGLVCAHPVAHGAFPGDDGRISWVESQPVGDDVRGRSVDYVQRRVPDTNQDGRSALVCQSQADRHACPYRSPSFSPSGRLVVLSIGLAEGSGSFPPRRWVLAVGGANEARAGSDGTGIALPALTDADRDPAWSPDGERIVFSGEVGGDRDLYVVNRDGGGLRRLTSGPEADREPNWSSRGEIAFVRGQVLYRVRPDGTGLTRLDRRGRRPDWSPDGRRLVFSHRQRLFLLRRDGRHYRALLRRGRGSYPAWSPSGRRIAFRRQRDIYTATPGGRRLRRVYNWGRPFGGSDRIDAPRDIDWGPRQR